MNDLDTPVRQSRSGPTDLPPYLDGPAEGMLAVARDLYVNPTSVALPDGRRLGYAETGDPDGTPILGFHGGLSNRLGAAAFDQIRHEMGIRFIAPQRPGIGVSDPAPDFSITNWPEDVAELLDALDRLTTEDTSRAITDGLVDREPRHRVSSGWDYPVTATRSW